MNNLANSVYYEYLKNSRKELSQVQDKMKSALLGPAFTQDEVRQFLSQAGEKFYALEEEDFYSTLAKEMAQGKVIGWFKGRMEYGPRVLGARSIIGDARNTEMQSLMNLKIKFRESFRPFAPAVLEEYAKAYFNLETASPYMLLVAEVRDEHRLELSDKERKLRGLEKLKQARSSIAAVTHVDYFARIQTVNEAENPFFYKLIKAFFTLTGCPVIINTSFNVMDEPIVYSPEDALRCFHKSDMDILAIENLIISKKKLL